MARITWTAPAPSPAIPTRMRRVDVEGPDAGAVLLVMAGLLLLRGWSRLHADGTCLGKERLHVRRDGAVLRRRATEALGLVTLRDNLDACSLCRIAEDVHRLLSELHLSQVVLQHLAVQDNALVGVPQALFGTVGDGALGDPGKDVLARSVIHQLPGRLALSVGQWQGDVKDWHGVLVQGADAWCVHSVED